MSRPGMSTVLAYGLFALIATVVNLGSQWCIMTVALAAGLPPRLAIWPALVIGTGTGLLAKYVLDKRFIFKDPSVGLKAHGERFFWYSVMGLATTVIFWGTEFIFSVLDPSGRTIYVGGAIGLAVGYAIKYELDRRWTFAPRTSQANVR